MTLDVESVVGCGMKREKSLRGSDALEPLHLPLPSSGRLMRILLFAANLRKRRQRNLYLAAFAGAPSAFAGAPSLISIVLALFATSAGFLMLRWRTPLSK